MGRAAGAVSLGGARAGVRAAAHVAQRAIHGAYQFSIRDRLRQPSDRIGAIRASARARIRERGYENAADTEPIENLGGCLNAVAGAGEPNIHHHQFRLMVRHQLNRFLGSGSDVDHLVTRFGQRVFELKRDQIIVFHDQDTAAAGMLSP